MLTLFSALAMTESLYSFLLLSALCLFVKAMEGDRRPQMALALSLAFAWLTRPEAQFVLVIFLAFILFPAAQPTQARPLSRRLRTAALVTLTFALTISPYILLLHAKTGRWTTEASVNISSPLLWQDGLAKEEYLYRLNAEGTNRALDEVKSDSRSACSGRTAAASRPDTRRM